MTEYSLETGDSLVIVSSGESEKLIETYELQSYDYTTGQSIDLTEEAITNAIVDVTSETKPIIYFINNHSAFPIEAFTTIMTELQNDANEVNTVDLLTTGKVPEDCSCLVITTLKEDITEIERDYIIDYINKGGKILALCGETTGTVTLTNFNQILDLYGISLEEGTIFEGETENMLSGYPDIIVEEFENGSLLKDGDNLKVALVDATPITLTEDEGKLEELNVEYERLITTSDSAFVRKNLNITSTTRTSQDSEEGTYIAGVLATKTLTTAEDSEESGLTSKLIVYSNSMFTTDMAIPLGQYQYPFVSFYNNIDIVPNAVLYLNEREDIITIRKNYDTVTFTATQSQENIVKAIIFITPIVIMVMGIVVWLIRRRI